MLPRVENAKSEQEFFNILEASLDYLKDGHVWMISPFKQYSCQTYLNDENGDKYPGNFDASVIVDYYLKEKFRTMASGITFGEIERDGHTYAYIYYRAFDGNWTADDYMYIEPIVKRSEGIIFDIRNNPGGSGDAGLNLAGNFFDVKTHVGYTALKNGKGHNDFTEMKAIYCTPSKSHNWSNKKTMLLTNREVYSTANLFTCALKHANNVTQIGGISGGGGGMPMTHYLPNGWLVVFPGNVLLDVNKQHIESGIEPDIWATSTDEDFNAGRDVLIETALTELMK
jgi:C-terminal processing protease CtpA/Prc